ncbi:hypothetical protein CVT24_008288 [Panaeolus cyanescens]|uniref:Thioesterase domain-containing protein n=1 Tax=Panaeolus cyanescens TaxID=181874 RepID=A0A409WWM1_9AGAR|nr:hypothetical protein CVT24_008288 [Panaeolus cyanescens]
MSSAHAVALMESAKRLLDEVTLANLLRVAPKLAKILFVLLFLINIRSWPLAWHFRVFRPVFALRIQRRWMRICASFKSPANRVRIHDQWMESISPIGENPLQMMVPFKSWASLDDSDFNGHLSNSSYAKILDSARFKAAMKMFPYFFTAGGWMALAATHYHFVREIPILKSYEIRTSIVAWDQKWIYIVSRFVRKPEGKKKPVKKIASPPSDSEPAPQILALRTPATEDPSTSGTPIPAATPLTVTGLQDTAQALKAVSAGLKHEEVDGSTLHTVAVARLCFKVGRITVPPAVVLGSNGFTGETGFSKTTPHPEWAQQKKVASLPHGGSLKKLKQFMTGGWKDVPEKERWWEQALGPEIEQQRLRNLALVEGLSFGLENARNI